VLRFANATIGQHRKISILIYNSPERVYLVLKYGERRRVRVLIYANDRLVSVSINRRLRCHQYTGNDFVNCDSAARNHIDLLHLYRGIRARM
jgi:hypothetical protein